MEGIRNIIACETEGSSAAAGFLEPLEAGLPGLRDALATDTCEFRDADPGFMRVVARERLEGLPCKDLPDVINRTRRQGLESSA